MSDIDDMLLGKDSDLELLKKAVGELGVRFDAVQVFATRYELDSAGTVNCHWGCGNFFARYGHVRQWVVMEENGLKEGGGI